MAKPKPKYPPASMSFTLPPSMRDEVKQVSSNTSDWIRKLVEKELVRLRKLDKVGKRSQED